jgi:hypothetical protein
MHRDIGEPSPRLVLLQKHIHKIDKLVRLLEAREKKILLQLLVIILDKFTENSG